MEQGHTEEGEDKTKQTPVSGRIYVIGDIHGCETESTGMIDFLRYSEDIGRGDTVVFIGDYIDRGPNAFGVVDQILQFRETTTAAVRCLKGNHEEMFLSYLGFEGMGGEAFLINGGDLTLESYRINPRFQGKAAADLMPAEHLQFFQNLERIVELEHAICVHAGLHPLYAIEEQRDEDVYWIRDEFIANVHHFDKVVVFGHTPFQDILIDLPYKIGIDTGLVYGNALTCIELGSEQVFQLASGGDGVECFSFTDKLQFQPV
jgi:serine/threonine protein phosphatase 1